MYVYSYFVYHYTRPVRGCYHQPQTLCGLGPPSRLLSASHCLDRFKNTSLVSSLRHLLALPSLHSICCTFKIHTASALSFGTRWPSSFVPLVITTNPLSFLFFLGFCSRVLFRLALYYDLCFAFPQRSFVRSSAVISAASSAIGCRVFSASAQLLSPAITQEQVSTLLPISLLAHVTKCNNSLALFLNSRPCISTLFCYLPDRLTAI